MPSSACQKCALRSEEHTSELQSHDNLVCRLLLDRKHTPELQSHDNLVCRLLLERKNTRAHQRAGGGPARPREQAPAPSVEVCAFLFFFKESAPPRIHPLSPPPPFPI